MSITSDFIGNERLLLLSFFCSIFSKKEVSEINPKQPIFIFLIFMLEKGNQR